MGKKISKMKKEKIITAANESGKSISSVAKEFGVAASTVSSWIKPRKNNTASFKEKECENCEAHMELAHELMDRIRMINIILEPYKE